MISQIMAVLLFMIVPYQTKPIQSYVTKNLQIHYEKKIPSADIKELAGIIEERYVYYQNLFGAIKHDRIEVNVYATVGRFRLDSHSAVFNDGDYNDGTMYLVLQPSSIQKEKMRSVVSRIVAKKFLEDIPWCPSWFADAYSLFAGNDLMRFGHPVQVGMSAFTDLNEEYSRLNETKNAKELYAKLAATIHFLIERYGERKVETALLKFKDGGTLEKTFESVFNEKITEIEKEWIQSLRIPYKDD
jgi:hypothetical protein